MIASFLTQKKNENLIQFFCGGKQLLWLLLSGGERKSGSKKKIRCCCINEFLIKLRSITAKLNASER
jgi:hypothetical protein